MSDVYTADPARFERSERWDRWMHSWPGFRNRGDYFVIVLRHTSDPPERVDTSPAPA